MDSKYLDGFENFDKLLGNLPKEVANKIGKNAVNAGIREALPIVKAAAPREEGTLSKAAQKYGRLVENIKVKAVKGGHGITEISAKITTGNSFWGYFYERGTRRQPARPWMLPAFKSAESRMISKMQEVLSTQIQAAFEFFNKK